MTPNIAMREQNLSETAFESTAKINAAIPRKWTTATPRRVFHVGIVVSCPDETGDHIMALSNAACPCVAVAIAMLSGDATEWCQRHKFGSKVQILGLDQLLKDGSIDGVYITGSFENKAALIEESLRAGKHVLADDPITTSVEEYSRLIAVAHACERHLQDTTMFVYHHAVREFLTCVLNTPMFGEIRKVDATFDINPLDDRFIGKLAANNIESRRGCIGDLCRYCAVLGTLIFTRCNRKATSVQVLWKELDDEGLPAHAICVVNYEGGARLTVDSSYIRYAGTRQSVDVHSESHSASMSDFVFASHSLACYRLYQKHTMNGKVVVEQGDSIDVEGGPLQEVCVWIRFAELASQSYTPNENESSSSSTLFNRYDFTFAGVQSQNIVRALMESLQNGCNEVKLCELELDIPVRNR